MNQNKRFLDFPLQNAAEVSGVAGKIRCQSLHRFQIPGNLLGMVSDAG
jgi:hypothetical protein